MNPDFAAINLHVYHSVVSVFLDAVIWCLGPYADDSRDYGLARHLLARLTRRLCGLWLGVREARRDAESQRHA